MTGNPVGPVEFLQQRLDDQERSVLHMDCGCADGSVPYANCPAFILADIAAKRRIIEHVRPVAEDDLEYSGWQDFAGAVLNLLAAPLSSHPDWQPEWSVE